MRLRAHPACWTAPGLGAPPPHDGVGGQGPRRRSEGPGGQQCHLQRTLWLCVAVIHSLRLPCDVLLCDCQAVDVTILPMMDRAGILGVRGGNHQQCCFECSCAWLPERLLRL